VHAGENVGRTGRDAWGCLASSSSVVGRHGQTYMRDSLSRDNSTYTRVPQTRACTLTQKGNTGSLTKGASSRGKNHAVGVFCHGNEPQMARLYGKKEGWLIPPFSILCSAQHRLRCHNRYGVMSRNHCSTQKYRCEGGVQRQFLHAPDTTMILKQLKLACFFQVCLR